MSGNDNGGLGFTCQLCGEHFPNDDAIWEHPCPEWEREVRRAQPRLAVYKNIESWFRTAVRWQPWRKKLLEWGLRQVFPDNPDADVIDALGKLGPRHARRLEKKLIRRGYVETRERSELDTLRKKLEVEQEPDQKGRRKRKR